MSKLCDSLAGGGILDEEADNGGNEDTPKYASANLCHNKTGGYEEADQGKESGAFTLLGDGMIIVNALCGAFAGLMTRGVNRRVDVFVGTGYSLGVGGALLIIPGLLLGGPLPHTSLWGFVILLLLIGISTIGFALYNKLLTCNPMGKVAIWNSLIPVVGAVTSCLCLGETFHPKYILAAGMAAVGIYIINKGKK